MRVKIALHAHLLDRPKHVRFLVFSAIALLIIAFLMSQYYVSSVQITGSVAREALTSTAEILTTTLAISVSLLLVSLQFTSEAYTPRVTMVILSDEIFLGYLITYSITIFLIEGLLTFVLIPLQIFLPYSYLLLILCIIYLLVVIFHVPSTLHPVRVLLELSKTVRKDFCENLVERTRGRQLILGPDDEPFVALEQFLLGAVVQNDFSSFLNGIKYIESLLHDFLTEVSNQMITTEKKSLLREKPSGVFGYFIRIYRQIVSETISYRRELHITYVSESLKRLMIQLHEMKAFRAFEWTAELIDYAGLRGLDVALLAFMDDYVRGLEELTKAQMQILDEPVSPFDDLGKSHDKLSEEERDLRAVRGILYRDLNDRFDFVTELAVKAAKHDLLLLVSSCMHIFSEALDKTLSLEPIERKRGVLRTLVMPVLVEAHKKCVQNGANETTFTTGMLQYEIEGMKKEDVPEFGTYVASAYAEMARASIENGFVEEEFHWGVIARSLVKDFPEITKIAISVIVDALAALKGRNDEKSKSWYSLARKDLEGLKTWDNHGHEGIMKIIDEELAKFSPMSTM